MSIKILHIMHSLQVGGLENGVVNLINRLDSLRFDHVVCCIASSGPMADRFERPVPVHVIGKGEQRDSLLPLKIARVVRQVRPDIVHTRNWGTIDGVLGARLAGVSRVVHGEHGREATDPTGANRKRKVARRLLHPLITRFVTVSADLRDWLVRDVGIPRQKVVQIINGVDTDRFAPANDRRVAREQAGVAPDAFVIGTVGRLDPVKNQQLLIRALAALRRSGGAEGRRLQLLIVGAGPEREHLFGLAAELGVADAVRLAGEQRDIPAHLRAMDLFVLPSLAEGISNTVLEAMATGLPVLATAVGGNGELVDEGTSGYLFPSGDVDQLSALMSRCASYGALVRSLGEAARQRIEERFSLTAMAEAYGRMYEEVGRAR